MRRITKISKTLNMKNIERILLIPLLLILMLPTYGCKEDLDSLEQPGSSLKSAPIQYDTPFGNVPETADIIMYEVNLLAFSPEGTLQGVQTRLDAIKDVGVNVVWLMPIHPIGELKGIGSPYAVRDHRQVNPKLGSLENLREFVKEAHKRDMAVILDWVANHTSWDNSWIQHNKSWYTQNTNGEIVSPQGWTDVAQLNFNNQEMRKEMISAMKYWILEANIDGYRCDYADGVPNDFWKQAIDTLTAIPNREIIMFAEGAKKDHFSSGFSLNFGWNFYGKLKEVFNQNASSEILSAANEADYSGIQANAHVLRFISNHDDNAWDNTPLHIFKGKQGSLAAFAITAFMGGVPLIYTGQEVGYPEQLSFFEQTPVDWTINPEITNEYQKLITLRKSNNALKRGKLIPYNNDSDIVAFKRVLETDEVVVLVNVRNRSIEYTLPQQLADSHWHNAFSSSKVTLGQTINLQPFSYLVLKN